MMFNHQIHHIHVHLCKLKRKRVNAYACASAISASVKSLGDLPVSSLICISERGYDECSLRVESGQEKSVYDRPYEEDFEPDEDTDDTDYTRSYTDFS
jgi:hypothetical protein